VPFELATASLTFQANRVNLKAWLDFAFSAWTNYQEAGSSQKRMLSLDEQFLDRLRIPSVPRCHTLILSNYRQTWNVYCYIYSSLELCLEMEYDFAMIPMFYLLFSWSIVSAFLGEILWLFPTFVLLEAVA
jgi:hypothetical protein